MADKIRKRLRFPTLPQCTCDIDRWSPACRKHGKGSAFFAQWMMEVEQDRKGAKTR